MLRTMLKSKLHSITVTEAKLNYTGSITIDKNLMKAANILPNEQVSVVNKNNGARFETYAISGEYQGVCLNGAAARLVQPGDKIIIMSYALYDDIELTKYKPTILFFDDNNLQINVHS